MKTTYMRSGFTFIIGLLALLGSLSAHAALEIFACEPEWAALSKELGGDKISVYAATTAKQDPHRIEARPSLIARTRAADLLVCSGSELEVGWLPVLLQTSGNDKVQVGKPGYFMAVGFRAQARTPDRSRPCPRRCPSVRQSAHPARSAQHRARGQTAVRTPRPARSFQCRLLPGPLQGFQSRWEKAIAEWEQRAAPLKGLRLVPYHKDSVYLIDWLGMVEVMNIEPKPGIPPSAGHLTDLLTKLQQQPADVIVYSAYQDPKAAEWLGERTKLPVVMLPYTVGGTPEAKDLYSLFDDSINRLLKAKK